MHRPFEIHKSAKSVMSVLGPAKVASDAIHLRDILSFISSFIGFNLTFLFPKLSIQLFDKINRIQNKILLKPQVTNYL